MAPRLNPFRLRTLAELSGADMHGDDVEISGAAGLTDAEPGDVTFLAAGKPAGSLTGCRAGAILVTRDFPALDRPHLRHENPRYVFTLALGLLDPRERPAAGVHPTAVVSPTASLGDGCSIGPYVVIEADAVIGARTVIGPFTVVERRATIGEDCRLDAHVVVYRDCIVGKRCTLFSGATIGCDGFGFEIHAGRIHRMAHVGITVLGDDVEIGSHTCVDRATTGQTSIGNGSKIDNLVMIGHNCTIGRSSLIAGMVGLAGSTQVGNGCFLGGSVKTADHAVIGDGAKLAGRSGVWSEVPPGVEWSGHPARDHRTEMRELMAIPRLPQLLRDFRELKRRVEALESPESDGERQDG